MFLCKLRSVCSISPSCLSLLDTLVAALNHTQHTPGPLSRHKVVGMMCCSSISALNHFIQESNLDAVGMRFEETTTGMRVTAVSTCEIAAWW